MSRGFEHFYMRRYLSILILLTGIHCILYGLEHVAYFRCCSSRPETGANPALTLPKESKEPKETHQDNKHFINCTNSPKHRVRVVQNGNFWKVYNFIGATKGFDCQKSVTYAAPGDLNFLDNLLVLVKRWEGPISISLYTPGSDYRLTLERLVFLRSCFPESKLIRKLVSFHIFFEDKHFPLDLNGTIGSRSALTTNCSRVNFLEKIPTFRHGNNLTYPLGLARNIANGAAGTHYFLSGDMEMYPNPGIIPKFLKLASQYREMKLKSKIVWVLPPFELSPEVSLEKLPRDKEELRGLLREKKANFFHSWICPNCHRVPRYKEWSLARPSKELNVFHMAKREREFAFWEPFYIGTKDEPPFDERFTWEGNKDKRIQAYLLCLQDYDFYILDNAFLVHRPEIKLRQQKSMGPINHINHNLWYTILPQYRMLYGNRKVCKV